MRVTAGGLAVAAVCFAITVAAVGTWTPYAAKRFYYPYVLPYDGGDVGGSEELGVPADVPAHQRGWSSANEIAEDAEAFLIGRFAGVLAYFPGLIVCALWSRRWGVEKLAWAGGLFAACAAILVGFPQSYFGGSHAIGNRMFVFLPVAFVFVDFVAWSGWRLLATAALATVVLPLVRSPVILSLSPGRQMLWAPYRYLPMEWAYVRRIQPPFSYPGMAAFTDAQYAWEGAGLWTRGGATAEFAFVRPQGQRPRVSLFSPLTDVRIRDGGAPVAWRPAESFIVELSNPVATTQDRLEGEESLVYVLTISTESVFRPRAHGNLTDNRYLGVYVQPIDRSLPQHDPAEKLNRPQAWWQPPDS
jgi:hypothetical protein